MTRATVEPLSWVATVGVPVEGPELREGINPDDVSPGVLGFVFIFGAALVSILLFLQMTSKVRRINHTEDGEDPSPEPPDDDAPPTGGQPRP